MLPEAVEDVLGLGRVVLALVDEDVVALGVGGVEAEDTGGLQQLLRDDALQHRLSLVIDFLRLGACKERALF